MWERMCRGIGRPDLLEDPRFASGTARRENGELLREEISKWSRERTKSQAMAELGAVGAPCSAVLDTRDLFTDPHLTERGFVKTLQHKTLGEVPVLGWPARLSESEVEITASPLLGEHTAEVLRAGLELDADEIEKLEAQKIIETYTD
jgi:formyl-CoA transferase